MVVNAVPVRLRRRAEPDQQLDVMPTTGTLVDAYGRVHTDLRISVTDQCNLRCIYCMPEDVSSFQARENLLSADEIERVAQVALTLGITSVRITGGEPLLRPGIVDIVRRLAGVGFSEVAMTTNGTRLARLAVQLVDAGLTRVNVSCDSLREDRFADIRRRGHLERVLSAMDAAEQAGLPKVKVNVVALHGVNDDEIVDFAQFARSTGREVRFIEFMPLDGDGLWNRQQVVAAATIIERIHDRWPLEAATGDQDDSAPATRYRFVDGRGSIGVVASVTEPFCSTCDRLRLTADGTLRNCLFSDREVSVMDVLRGGGRDDELEREFRRSVWAKGPGHGINRPDFHPPTRSMWKIGG
jgi:cyclic pyranopterin phosphate synthase